MVYFKIKSFIFKDLEAIMVHAAFFAGVGFVVGAITPAVGRKIKAFFVKESTAVAKKV